MSGYDLILVGGTGAQFGHAVFDGVGMGLLDAPQNTFVVDADRAYFTDTLEPLHKNIVIEAHKTGPGNAPVPRLQHVAPYHHGGGQREFSLADLMGTKAEAISDLGRLCLTQEEVTYQIDKGLFGMAKLGGVLTGMRRKGDFPENILSMLDSTSASPIVLAGSIAGGTGAGFLLPLIKAIRDNPALSARPVYAMTFLPWFDLPNNGNTIGPNNKRMKRNASQGVLFASRLVEEKSFTQAQAQTSIMLLGLPDNERPPQRNSTTQKSEPSPLLYYGASLLSGGFSAIKSQQTTHGTGTKSGIFAVRCHPNTSEGKPFAGLIQFALSGSQMLPFEGIDSLLAAQIRALNYLGNDIRFEQAFGRFIDNPDYLPKTIYRAIAQRRNLNTAGKIEAGRTIAARCRSYAKTLEQQRERLRSHFAGPEIGAGQGRTPVEAWWIENLENVDKLDRHIAAELKQGILDDRLATNQLEDAAEYIVRCLTRGLSKVQGINRIVGNAGHGGGTALALPVQAQTGGSQSGILVELDDRLVKMLATALVQTDSPDSQCIPSPLARSHLTEFYVEKAISDPDPIGPDLAGTHEGRHLLTIAGLMSGKLRFAKRTPLREGTGDADTFAQIVVRQESTDGARPVRSHWLGMIGTTAGDDVLRIERVVAGTAPRTLIFNGVRTDETQVDSGLGVFRRLFQELQAQDKDFVLIRSVLRVFLEDVISIHPDCREIPWARLIEKWTKEINLNDARKQFAEAAFYGVGPVTLQVGFKDSTRETPKYESFYLPWLMPKADRERLAAVVASAFVAPKGQLDGDVHEGILTLKPVVPPGQRGTPLVRLRVFECSGLTLSPEEELLSGSAELIDGYTQSSLISGSGLVQSTWALSSRVARSALRIDASTPLNAGALMRKAADNGANWIGALKLDASRLALFDSNPGPRAPALVNLFSNLN